MSERPRGSNADEWHLFLIEHLDNRATHPNGLTFMAWQIAMAIEDIRAECVDTQRMAFTWMRKHDELLSWIQRRPAVLKELIESSIERGEDQDEHA
jgi:hypothetical protein